MTTEEIILIKEDDEDDTIETIISDNYDRLINKSINLSEFYERCFEYGATREQITEYLDNIQ